MFDRFVRLAQARKALRDGHFEEAIRLVDDPDVRGHRKAEVLRGKALEGLLARARRRAEAGGLSAALSDCERALTVRPEDGAAAALRAELNRRAEDGAGRTESVRAMCRDARRAAGRGELDEAEGLIDAAGRIAELPEVVELRERVAADRKRAADLVRSAADLRRRGQLDDASDALARARALDRAVPEARAEAAALAKARAPELAVRLDRVLDDEGPVAARAIWRKEISSLPELAEMRRLRDLLGRMEQDDRRRAVELLENGAVEAAVEMFRNGSVQVGEGLAPIMGQLARACSLAGRGELRDAAELARDVAEDLGIDGLARRCDEWTQAAERVDGLMQRAREEAASGRLLEARATLLEVIRDHPEHAAARREMELLEQGAEDRARRIADARAMAREGRLREAAALVVTLSVSGPEGEEARILLRDLQQRMDTVAAGVRQVLRAMHGRDSATREGLAHCVRRLEELEKVQSDDAELAKLKDAALAEMAGIDCLSTAKNAFASGDLKALREEFGRMAEDRVRLLSDDRLDARVLELVDDVLAEAERSVSGGRPARCSRLVEAVEPWTKDRPDTAARIAEIRARAGERQESAARHVEAVRSALAARDLEGADAALAHAREAALDDPAVQRADEEILSLRRRELRLQDVEGLAERRDFDRARRELGRLGPTPSLLRTRIYDLKRNLAQAQGLEGAFLLRVDEGGEFLVVRGESLTVGNLRDGTSDLPILASLAGRHARLRRTLSFHGGQEDRVVAERGELWVDGRKVDSAKLVDRMRFRLGPSVEMEYRVPCERSLTAALAIRGGFQVAGTDTVLWMKDRGRDGRILIGPGKDVHVCVDGAEGVVEIFAGRDGQIRVRCEGAGTIDGRPFQGEHPATAGSVVRCVGISFVLQPWGRG